MFGLHCPKALSAKAEERHSPRWDGKDKQPPGKWVFLLSIFFKLLWFWHFLSFVFCHLEVDNWITLCDRKRDGSCLLRNIKFFNSLYCWISYIFVYFIKFFNSFYCWISYIFVYLSYLTLSTCMGRAFLLTSMCILGKNGSIPRQEKKTKKRMVPTPFTKAEDGEGHHPCRKSSLIYSLAQSTEDRHD